MMDTETTLELPNPDDFPMNTQYNDPKGAEAFLKTLNLWKP